MDPLGTALGIAHVLKRARDLYTACKAAPEELRLAGDHVHTMALVLTGVHSDLIKNQHSFLHQNGHSSIARIQNLKQHTKHCENSLKRMEGLLGTFNGFKKAGGMRAWDKFRWSTDGKREIAECKADLVLCTSMLDLFLSKEGLNVLWKVESMIENMMKRFEALESLSRGQAQKDKATSRPRRASNIGRTILLSLVVSRLKRILTSYRRKKMTRKGVAKPSNMGPGPRRPKRLTRVTSGFTSNPTRDKMIQTYARTIANTSAPTSSEKPQRARAPSPDFYYISTSSPPPINKPIRRSSSMQRLLGTINTKSGRTPSKDEYLSCWRVGLGRLAFGPKTAPQFLKHNRGQMQLRKIAAVFKEAAQFGARGLTEQDLRVKAILKAKNNQEKEKQTKKRWYFVAGRITGIDNGKTGMVSVEKAMVILSRR